MHFHALHLASDRRTRLAVSSLQDLLAGQGHWSMRPRDDRRLNDPDETEGRALYRARANSEGRLSELLAADFSKICRVADALSEDPRP